MNNTATPTRQEVLEARIAKAQAAIDAECPYDDPAPYYRMIRAAREELAWLV